MRRLVKVLFEKGVAHSAEFPDISPHDICDIQKRKQNAALAAGSCKMMLTDIDSQARLRGIMARPRGQPTGGRLSSVTSDVNMDEGHTDGSAAQKAAAG